MDKIIELVRSAKLLASNAGYVIFIKMQDNDNLANDFSTLLERHVEDEIIEILEWYLKNLKERIGKHAKASD